MTELLSKSWVIGLRCWLECVGGGVTVGVRHLDSGQRLSSSPRILHDVMLLLNEEERKQISMSE